MNEVLEALCRGAGKAAGIALGLSSIGAPLYLSDDWERRALQHEIQKTQEITEGTLHYIPLVNSFQGTVVLVTKHCEENPQNKNYDCQLSFQDVPVVVHYSPKTVGMLSRFDEAAALKQTCFLSATPMLRRQEVRLELTSLSCQKTEEYMKF